VEDHAGRGEDDVIDVDKAVDDAAAFVQEAFAAAGFVDRLVPGADGKKYNTVAIVRFVVRDVIARQMRGLATQPPQPTERLEQLRRELAPLFRLCQWATAVAGTALVMDPEVKAAEQALVSFLHEPLLPVQGNGAGKQPAP
jgi:hypothetical protein